LGFVEAVLVAEAGFEDAGLGASAEDLQGNEDEKNEEVPRTVEKENEAEDPDVAKKVDGIANAGVQAVGDELARLRRDGERGAELDARDDNEHDAEDKQDEADEAQRSPGMRPIHVEDPDDGERRDDDEEEELAIHGEMIARREEKRPT
jgi:hypothetical protein